MKRGERLRDPRFAAHDRQFTAHEEENKHVQYDTYSTEDLPYLNILRSINLANDNRVSRKIRPHHASQTCAFRSKTHFR